MRDTIERLEAKISRLEKEKVRIEQEQQRKGKAFLDLHAERDMLAYLVIALVKGGKDPVNTLHERYQSAAKAFMGRIR